MGMRNGKELTEMGIVPVSAMAVSAVQLKNSQVCCIHTSSLLPLGELAVSIAPSVAISCCHIVLIVFFVLFCFVLFFLFSEDFVEPGMERTSLMMAFLAMKYRSPKRFLLGALFAARPRWA